MLEDLRGGRNQRAWREFFCAYAPMLTAFAKRLGLSDANAADAVQETLLAVYTAFRDMPEPFDRSKGRFKSWLRGIAQHKIRDVQRRRARRERTRAERAVEERDELSSTTELDELFELEWQRNLLARGLEIISREVDPAVFQTFELYVIHGQSPDQVAKFLGTTRNAVYINKVRVLQRLRTVVAELVELEG